MDEQFEADFNSPNVFEYVPKVKWSFEPGSPVLTEEMIEKCNQFIIEDLKFRNYILGMRPSQLKSRMLSYVDESIHQKLVLMMLATVFCQGIKRVTKDED